MKLWTKTHDAHHGPEMVMAMQLEEPRHVADFGRCCRRQGMGRE
jgi:hypothetical protein